MKSSRDIEKLVKELHDTTNAEMDERVLRDVSQALDGPSRLNVWRIIMKSKITKLAAAAVIIITMILCANFLGGRDSTNGGIYQDSKMLVKYLFSTSTWKSDMLLVRSRYEYLVRKGKEAAYYGDSITPQDNDAVLMHWKLSDNKYRVTFADLREETVTADELIKIQARMLQKKIK